MDKTPPKARQKTFGVRFTIQNLHSCLLYAGGITIHNMIYSNKPGNPAVKTDRKA